MNKLVTTVALLVAAVSAYDVLAYSAPTTNDVYSVEINLKTTKRNVVFGKESVLEYRSVTTKAYKGFYIVEDGFSTLESISPEAMDNVLLLGINGWLFNAPLIMITGEPLGKKGDEVEVAGVMASSGILSGAPTLNGEVSKESIVANVRPSSDVEAIAILMGFGNYDLKNDRVSSINGSIMVLVLPYDLFDTATYGSDLAALSPAPESLPQPSIAYGTFSMKYSLEASRREAADDYEWIESKLGVSIRPR
jgi:hypothetical protein